MSDIRVGDRVSFRAGRGHSIGRVANIAEGMATISTENGKSVNRKLSQLAKVPHVGQPTGATRVLPDGASVVNGVMVAAPVCSADAAV